MWLKEIVSRMDWPSEIKVGKQGELYAWLITQHSRDIGFQKLCLGLLEDLPETRERNQHVGYLTDRILVNENKKQIYGTQFSNGHPYPIINKNELNKRRDEMNLGSFDEYCKLMKKI